MCCVATSCAVLQRGFYGCSHLEVLCETSRPPHYEDCWMEAEDLADVRTTCCNTAQVVATRHNMLQHSTISRTVGWNRRTWPIVRPKILYGAYVTHMHVFMRNYIPGRTHWRREQLKSEVADVFKYLLEDVADQSIRHADLLRSLRTAFEAIARLLSASNCIRKLVRAGTPRRSAMPIMRVGIPPRLAGARVCSRLDETGDPARRVFRKARAAAACYVCVRAILTGSPRTSLGTPSVSRGAPGEWVSFGFRGPLGRRFGGSAAPRRLSLRNHRAVWCPVLSKSRSAAAVRMEDCGCMFTRPVARSNSARTCKQGTAGRRGYA